MRELRRGDPTEFVLRRLKTPSEQRCEYVAIREKLGYRIDEPLLAVLIQRQARQSGWP